MSPEPTTKGSASNPAPAASTGSPERGAASIRYVDRADADDTDVEDELNRLTGICITIV
jgi:hypothetical protein